jgi:DUF4097 and DUF4098 domain-containing protein YvlB
MNVLLRRWRSAALLLCLGLAGASGCSRGSHSVHAGGYQFDFQGETASRHLDGEIPAQTSRIEIRHQFGEVEIAPAADVPTWNWEVTCWAATPEQAQRFAEAVTLTVTEQDNLVRWQLTLPEPPVPDLRGVKSRLVLSVPESVAVDLENSFGQTSVSGIRGGTVARCEHGALQLTGLSGPIDASTSHAELQAENIAAAKLSNEHGALHAAHVHGDLEARTSFGECRVESVTGGARLNNEHGSVFAKTVAGDLGIATSHAAVEVEDVSGALTIDNQHGSIKVSNAHGEAAVATSFSSLELQEIGGNVRARNEHGSITGSGVRGPIDAQTSFAQIELDSAAPEVICRNEHGSIQLTVRNPSLSRVQAETSFGSLELRIAAPLTPRIEAHTEHGDIQSDYPVLRIQSGADNFSGAGEGVPRITLRNEHGSIRVMNASGDSPAGAR